MMRFVCLCVAVSVHLHGMVAFSSTKTGALVRIMERTSFYSTIFRSQHRNTKHSSNQQDKRSHHPFCPLRLFCFSSDVLIYAFSHVHVFATNSTTDDPRTLYFVPLCTALPCTALPCTALLCTTCLQTSQPMKNNRGSFRQRDVLQNKAEHQQH